jgi:hypothetical protein
MELQQQAQEAHIREAEAEKRRQEEAEHHRYKLQVARDMLQHLRPKLSLNKKEELNIPQLTHQAKPKTGAPPLSQPTSLPAGNVQQVNGREATRKAPQPDGQISAVPPSSTLN